MMVCGLLLLASLVIAAADAQPPRGGSSNVLSPIDQILATMSTGQIIRLDATSGSGTYLNKMTPKTKANFNGAIGEPFASDAAASSGMDQGNAISNVLAFSGVFVSQDGMQVGGFGGGHAASNRNDVMGFDVNAALTSIATSSTPGSWRNVMKASAMLLGTDTNCPPSGPTCPPSPSRQPNPGSSAGSYWIAKVNLSGEGSGDGPVRIGDPHSYHANLIAAPPGSPHAYQAVIGGNSININNQGPPGGSEVIDFTTTNSNIYCASAQNLGGGAPAMQFGFAAQDSAHGVSAGSIDYNDDDDQIVDAAVQTLNIFANFELLGWPLGSLWRTCDPTTFAGTPLTALYTNASAPTGWATGSGFIWTIKYFHDVGTPTQGDVFQHICTGDATACPSGNYLVVKNMRPGHTGSTSLVVSSYAGTDCLAWGGDQRYAAWSEQRAQGNLLRFGGDANIYQVSLTSALTTMACSKLTALSGATLPSNANSYTLAMRAVTTPAGNHAAVLAMPDEANGTVGVFLGKLP